MKISKLFLAIFLLTGLLFSACVLSYSKEKKQEENESQHSSFRDKVDSDVEEAKDDLEVAMEEVEEAINKLKDEAVEHEKDGEMEKVVNFRELKKILPKRVAGISMTDSSGETGGVFGLKISTAEAEYKKGDQKIEVSIADVGGFGSTVLAIANWTDMEFDRESSDGYERTTTIDGYKAFEKYNERSESGELAIFYDDRFIVTIKGKNVSESDLKSTLRKLDLKDLKKL